MAACCLFYTEPLKSDCADSTPSFAFYTSLPARLTFRNNG
jgi:hypothetical protein